MALRSVINSRYPTIIILGATGTGKTKLSVELAQKFNTEIISADSMQVYKGLDIVTAKPSQHERSLATHHLLDVLEPHQAYTVVDFRNRALKMIDNLVENEKIPIVVGGTTYYMESIVWNILVETSTNTEELLWDKDERQRKKRQLDAPTEAQDAKKPNIEDTHSNVTTADEVSKVTAENTEAVTIDKEKLTKDIDDLTELTNAEIYEKLKEVDPAMASRLHPNNRRKILRSLEVFQETGRRNSEILDAQAQTEGMLRRPGATLILWLKCGSMVHDDRLNARVDSMIEEGLVQELVDFHKKYNENRLKDGPPDYTKGIYQTLGFKEFHEYLMLNPEQQQSETGKKLLELSLNTMKMATRRFARKQNKMVLSRFTQHPRRQIPPMYSLDTTDLTKWDECVKNKAIHIIESFINGTECQYEPVQSNIDEEKKSVDVNSSNYCEVCQRIIIGDKVYKIHLESNKHKKILKRLEKIKEKKTE